MKKKKKQEIKRYDPVTGKDEDKELTRNDLVHQHP